MANAKKRIEVMDPAEVLKAYVVSHGSRKAAAVAIGITEQYLGDILNGNRGFSDAVLAKLGLKSAIVKAS